MTPLRPLARLVLPLLPLAFLVACGGEPGGPAGAPRLDATRWLGEPTTSGNLTVWPVHTSAPLDLGAFLTLEEAQAQGHASVREVGAGGATPAAQTDLGREPGAGNLPRQDPLSPPAPAGEQGPSAGPQQVQVAEGGAMVNTLVVENRGDLPILVLAGTVVKGGQQDRQFGQDVVIAAHSSVPVDAFCVEPARWSYRGGGGAGFEGASFGVAVQGVRSSGQYARDQGKVWEEVGKVLADRGIQATSTFVAAVEEASPEDRARRAATEESVLAHFARLRAGPEAPIGFAYAVNGKPVTVRAFAHPRLLAQHLPAFVKAMALEADLARDEPSVPAAAEAVVAMVRGIEAAREEVLATRGLNANGLREGEHAFGARCLLPAAPASTEQVEVTSDWTSR